MAFNNPIKKNEDVFEDIELNSCSACDCTGLIPSQITQESEFDAYEELYPYLSPQVNIKNNKNVDDIENNS